MNRKSKLTEVQAACNMIQSMRASSRKSYRGKKIRIPISGGDIPLVANTNITFNHRTGHVNFAHSLSENSSWSRCVAIYPTRNKKRKCINDAGLRGLRQQRKYKLEVMKYVRTAILIEKGIYFIEQIGYNSFLGSVIFTSWFVIKKRSPLQEEK